MGAHGCCRRHRADRWIPLRLKGSARKLIPIPEYFARRWGVGHDAPSQPIEGVMSYLMTNKVAISQWLSRLLALTSIRHVETVKS
ncbi:hypothetical protein BN381_80250 [Candidatus Microthrix parvicella RN1]|uniref:Uncharacterized protein n=1 Tax=Candidatus Neomicrothrix parvicella RN1 TaxID=1229780 RepID=R4Z4U2_9ACTN|nr:hypothetical protein BN381_80250 [Candidatus Microthrix parvicella RN1]